MAPTPIAALTGLLVVFGTVSADAPPRRLKVALTQTASAKTRNAGHAKDGESSGSGLPSGWFGNFDQDESTYTSEGLGASKDDPTWAVKYGQDPTVAEPYSNGEVLNSEFFHESQSGGSKAAWQTNYPSIEKGVAGNGVSENSWRYTPTGWHQDYNPQHEGFLEGEVQPSSADWFDNSVHQIDGFGRKMQPGLNDGQRYLAEGWKERSVNTTLKCKEIGCTAKSSLQLLDMTKEEAKLCRLSVHIHPTDYDDDWSREHVEFWKVNGHVASRQCNPRARGCNATAEKPLYPCLNGFEVDQLVDEKGTLVIEGKNSKMVDECPHAGNLLSGLAMATCLVRNKPVVKVAAPAPPPLFLMSDMTGTGQLKCNTPGCTAYTSVLISPAIALNGGTCKMSVTVHQTDFEDKKMEQIEFIQVEGVNVSKAAIQPGKNPCNAEYKGKKLKEGEKIFTALKDMDVTQLIKKSKHLGELKVHGKISDQVDECGFDGNLLNGNVTVVCTPPKKFAATPPAAATDLLHAPKAATTLLQQGATQRHLRAQLEKHLDNHLEAHIRA